MTTRTLSVPDISCDHCKNSIEGALDGVAGVNAASVTVEARTVDVEYDPQAVGMDEIVAVIEAQGYEVAR